MPTTRISYRDLPHTVRYAIEEVTGAASHDESANAGLNSAVAARIETPGGRYFVKAMPADHRWVFTQRREASIAPFVDTVAPRLVARIERDGWDVLIFEALAGRHADYSRDSGDLPKVVDLLEEIATIPCHDADLRDACQRLQNYVDRPDDLRYFDGSTLAHTDLNNANVLVSDRARIVDWGWATRGAPWLDAAYWTLWLIASGHDPKTAEWWASRVSTWQTASHDGVTAFVKATANLWDEIDGRSPDPDPWTTPLVNAAHRWRDFRTQ